MGSTRGRLTALCALALSLFGFAAAAWPAPLLGKYQRYEAGDYVIISSRGGAQARRIMEDLAKFRATLERTLDRHATNDVTPTTIVVTSAEDWDRWFRPLPGVTGYFRRGSFSNYMAIDGDASVDETLQVVFHEFTHYFLATRFAGEFPPWFHEGMAELMAYARFDKGVATLRIPTFRQNQARDGDWIPFERLIRVDQGDPEYQSHKLMPSFYAQSWLTVHYGMVESPEFRKQMFQYLADLNTLMPQEQAAHKAFGEDLSIIDRKLHDYSRSRISSGAINFGETAPVEIAAGHPLGEVETLGIVTDLMLDANQDAARVAPLLQVLEQYDPNKARVAIFRARIAQRADDNAGFDAAVSQAEAALAPGDWQLRRELGSVLLQSSRIVNSRTTRSEETIKSDVSRAMKLFAEAVTLNKQDVESLWGFGAAAGYLGQNLDLAEQSLLAAYQRAPSNAEIAAALANVKGQQGDLDGMLPYLKDVARFANDLQIRRWATETLIKVEQQIEESENRKSGSGRTK